MLKQYLKHLLRWVGLYKPVHRVWLRHSDIRLDLYNFGYQLAGAPDGLRIPPTRLIKLVQSSGELEVYLKNGVFGKDSICNILLLCGYHIEDFDRIHDFGCGCGRIMRYWKVLRGPCLFGTDLNPELIQWCQAKLGNLVEFKTNQLVPPLDYPDEYFDFVTSISMFTHLSELVQQEWMRELARVLKKNGLLLITVHGEWRVNDLNPVDKSCFRSGELKVIYEQYEGSNVCGAFHPEAYVRNNLAKEFEVLDFMLTGAIDVGQDIYLENQHE